MNLPDSWIETRLGNALNRVEARVDPKSSDDPFPFYVGLEHIESHSGRLLHETDEVTESSEIVSVKTVFSKGDILYGRLRPNLNKVYLAEQAGICSTEIWALRATNVIFPEFALYYLRSPAVYIRATQTVAGANLPRVSSASFDRIPLPLPTIAEQKRIVEVLRQTQAIIEFKRLLIEKIDQIVSAIYWEHFGEWYTTIGLRDPVRVSEYIADSQYGVSEAMEESGSHAILRMNSISTNGWLDLSDLKYANLSKKDAENTQLQDGDLLFNRTNSKDLVGKCGIWRGVRVNFSFASYLIRLRLKKGMLPEYLWATLNSTYGKYRLFNAAKQAVSMANVSPTDLGRITVPLPPLKLQEKFAKLVRQIETLRTEMLSKSRRYDELQALVTQQALLGELTASWREQNKQQLLAESKKRNDTLSQLGIRTHSFVVRVPEPVIFTKHTREQIRTARVWLIDELSEFQRNVLNAFIEYGQIVFTEDSDRFADFCSHESLTERLDDFSPNQIGRTISQLADLGLIAQVSLPANNSLTQQQEFVKAFRPLREEEYTKLADLETLRRSLSGSSQKEHHFFTVTLDYEPSARAGAAGMFQVISITDTDDNDRTNLVDQGTHYASLDELASDIADALGVEVDQVELEEVAEVFE